MTNWDEALEWFIVAVCVTGAGVLVWLIIDAVLEIRRQARACFGRGVEAEALRRAARAAERDQAERGDGREWRPRD